MRRLLGLALALLGAPTQAQEAAGDSLQPDYAAETLTGDWAGLRSAGYRRGVSSEFTYRADLLHSRGGLEQGGTAMGNLDAKLRLDTAKLTGSGDAILYLHLLSSLGGRQNIHRAGSLMGVSNIEVPANGATVFQAWIQKNLLGEDLSLLAGLYPIDTEFAVLDSAAVLVHPAFGATADLALTRGPAIFNRSALGGRVKWTAADRSLYAMGALLDGMPDEPENLRHSRIHLAKGDGSFAIAEVGWMPEEAGHVFEPTDPTTGLVRPAEVRAHEKVESFAKYALGLWRYSSRVEDLTDRSTADQPERRRSRGWYALGEKSLYRHPEQPDRHLAGFIRYSATDGDSTPIDWALNLGLRWRGLLASRGDDIAVLAFARGHLGTKWRALQPSSGHHEDALELGYRAQLTRWLAMQPLLQYIRHPAGAGPNVRLLGLRIEAAL